MSKRISDYALRVHLDADLEAAEREVVAALKEEGFGVLTEIDMAATLKEKLGVDFRPYRILGICNPPLAHEALRTHLEVGLLLPCKVILYEEDAGTDVAILDPLSMLEVMDELGVDVIAEEARVRLQRVVKAVAGMRRPEEVMR
jgi:uncharacterized protein (DUF302 family)